MQLSLRKAGQVRGAVERALREIKADPVLDLNVHEPEVAATVNRHREESLAGLERLGRLEDILYALRAAIGEANVSAGVDALLAERAKLEKRVSRLAALVTGAEPASLTAVERQAAAMREGRVGEEAIGFLGHRRQTQIKLKVQTLTAADVEALRDRLAATRRQLDAANDRILEKNVQVTVGIPEQDAGFLRNERVI